MKTSKRLTAILQAAFVAFLWSTSWVLIKFGLRANIPALTFAGLRYSLAFLCILPFVLLNPDERAALKNIPRAGWQKLILLAACRRERRTGCSHREMGFKSWKIAVKVV